jgi:hypothetical protein
VIQKELNPGVVMINTTVPGGGNVHNFPAQKSKRRRRRRRRKKEKTVVLQFGAVGTLCPPRPCQHM